MKKIYLIGFLLIVISCKKDWINVKSQQSLFIAQNLDDYQALLDNTDILNGSNSAGGIVPALGQLSCDDYFENEPYWQYVQIQERNIYLWNKDFYTNPTVPDWSYPYRAIYYANQALEGVSDITPDTKTKNQWNQVKGSALFFRAFCHFQLAQIFAPAYESSASNTQLSIPLKLSSDPNIVSVRSSNSEVYAQIIKDLNESVPLLPDLPTVKTRPSKASALALLSKVYLTTNDFSNAKTSAEASLKIYSKLIDYNAVDGTAAYPFPPLNDEIILEALMINRYTLLIYPVISVDTTLYNMYEETDLRKTLFFNNINGTIQFRGSYESTYNCFAGIATDELYLTLAECDARLGDISSAKRNLDVLLSKRYVTGTYKDNITDNDTLLRKIIDERRKELVFRGTRWHDLKRLNLDPKFAKSIFRQQAGTTYELKPGSIRYTLPIPQSVIDASGIPQNDR